MAGLRKIATVSKELNMPTSTLYYGINRDIPVYYVDKVPFIHRSDYEVIQKKLKKK